jgi:hypothetical protein
MLNELLNPYIGSKPINKIMAPELLRRTSIEAALG